MKRPPPPDPHTARAPTARQRRLLSEEERALWDAVAKSTRPLKHRARKPKPAVDAAVVAEPSDRPELTPVVPIPQSAPPVAGRAKPVPPLVALGRRERAQISRGKKDIDARLDLHGMTQARAHRALIGFLRRASEDGHSFVLVITGKGRTVGPDSERGVLRRQVPEWLSQPDLRAFVIGFEEAHIGHGGGGALYVRVRRAARLF
jgi:DNA-nicking Smr family endonuclease